MTTNKKKERNMYDLLKPVAGGVVGALVGLAVYKFVGCKSGACPMTANPFVAVALWGLMGVMIASGK